MDSKLCSEMIMEIMSRSSLKTLGIMRCASKELNKLAYEPYLLDLYKKRNKIVSGYVIQHMKRGCMKIKEFAPSPESNNLDLSFLPYNAQVLATSEQGIMVFKNQDPNNCRKYLYHVCKPATKQVLALPRPKGNNTDMKFAIVVMGLKPLHYKIIRFSMRHCCRALRRWRKLHMAYHCDIFDSMTWKWRSLKPVTLGDGVFLTNPQPVTNSGSIYMLLTNNNILKFDAFSEKWEVFPSPIAYDESTELVKYGGRLGLACKPPNANGYWDIWVYKMDKLWEKEADVAAESESERESLKALYDSDTSVMVNCETLLFYRLKQHEGNNMMISKIVLNDIPYQIFSFRSDFEPTDLK